MTPISHRGILSIHLPILIVLAVCLFFTSISAGFAQGSTQNQPDHSAAIDRPIQDLDKPLYSPFTARYMLDEVRNIHIELEKAKADLVREQVSREYKIASDSARYAQQAVELFFYIIVAITTLLVFVGWKSFHDINDRIRTAAESRVDKLVAGYSERLDSLEAELEQKSERIKAAQVEINETNDIHSLWLRASQETRTAGKIAIYDEILSIRPHDTDALTYKADAALNLDQPRWALSLANRALDIDPDCGQALYQRACAYACMGEHNDAVIDLRAAIENTYTFKSHARVDTAFESMAENEEFRELVDEPVELDESNPTQPA